MEETRGVGDDPGAASPITPAAAEFALHLLSLRAAMRVGTALMLALPDEEAVDTFFNRPDVLEALSAFGEVREDIAQLAVVHGQVDEVLLARAVQNHRGRALEALELLADELMLPVDDLVSVLLRA